VVQDGPVWTGTDNPAIRPRTAADQRGIGIGIPAGPHVVAARPLVAQGPVDQQEKRWCEAFGHKPRRGDAHKGAASKSEQFLGDQDGKRGSDRAADHAVFVAPFPPTEEACMETGPGGILGGPSRVGKVLDKFPVEVQEASGRDSNLGQPPPDPGSLKQVCRLEDGASPKARVPESGIRMSSATDRHLILPAFGLFPVDLLLGLPDDGVIRGNCANTPSTSFGRLR